MSKAHAAIVDWGTTRLRIWLVDQTGKVLNERRSNEGLLAAQPNGFSAILERHLNDMGADASLPVVICGMAGARNGWREACYVMIPASLDTIFESAIRAPTPGRDVRILPGLALSDARTPDVMRGEETQLVGALSLLGPGRHLVCLPGTHSKWVLVDNGVVVSFQTFMTGELFSVLSMHSILNQSIGGDSHVEAGNPVFLEWARSGLAEPAAFETRLFRIRSSALLGTLAPQDAACALSGLLIGAETTAARGRLLSPGQTDVALVASGEIRELYEVVLREARLTVTLIDAEDAVREGLTQAMQHLFLRKAVA